MGFIISNGKLVKYMEEHGGKENTTMDFSNKIAKPLNSMVRNS